MQECIQSELPFVLRWPCERVGKEDREHKDKGKCIQDQGYQAKDIDGASSAIVGGQQVTSGNLQGRTEIEGTEETDI